MQDLLAARDAAGNADMVELRLDGVAGLDVAAALRDRRRPVVVTCRPTWEGGRFDGTESERREILRRALELGADFVDVEWRAGFDDLVEEHGARIVLSCHDFDRVPPDLSLTLDAMRVTAAGVTKVAVMASSLSDMIPLLDLASDGRTIVIAMGAHGVASRLLAARFGSPWTYAGDGVAPGQIPAFRMLEEFRFRDVGADTRVYGVVSGDASHSLSPAMHNAAFAAADIDAVYVPLSATSFDDFERFAAAVQLEGASVTIPYKLDALRAAADVEPVAREVGAANTLRRSSRGWDATNTDVEGFLAPLDEAYDAPLRNARVAVLGAGGAARAVVVALRDRGARVVVHARRSDRARDVAEELGVDAGAWPPPPGSWDLLVNTTPLGGTSARDESPLPGGPFGGRLVYDLTYGPGESRLVREARAAGCRTLDGLAMLVAQAERQFGWWTGEAPVPGVMRAAAERRAGLSQDRDAATAGGAMHGTKAERR
jgi:3-dehydroquinate dehydratase/shikimate dehydrogenase